MRHAAGLSGVAVALLSLLLLPPAAARATQSPRIVAVGDIHGAVEAFRSILVKTGLIDQDDNWAGGDTVLVQTGDFLDRGAESVQVAFWLMRLQAQAPEAGGRVIVLLGNHEAMNLLGDLRFVPPEMVEPLIDKSSTKRRFEMCKERTAVLRRDAKALKLKAPPASAVRQKCHADTPLGLIEYQTALGTEQPLGHWLRSLPAVARVGDTVFLHGGISPAMASHSIEEINEMVRREIETFDSWRRWLTEHGRMVESANLQEMARAIQVELELRKKQVEEGIEPDPAAPNLAGFFEMSDHLLLATDGPLWFRGYDSWSDEEGLTLIRGILEALAARQVVVGHTPQEPRRIHCRFGGRAFLIDTGMLESYYNGVPAALEIAGESVEGIYLDEKVVFVETPGGRRVAEGCR